MWRLLLLIVTGAMVSSIGMNCGNLSSPVGTVDTLYINSRDTIYRIDTVLVKNSYDTVYRFDTVLSKDTVYSKDTVHVETLLVNRSVYIDTAGNRYSKTLAFKGRIGDLPFERDSVITMYSIRTQGDHEGVFWTFWYPAGTFNEKVVDTVDTGTITYGYYILATGAPIDSGWIMAMSSFDSYSFSNSSIRIYWSVKSWATQDTSPASNTGTYKCFLVSPVK